MTKRGGGEDDRTNHVRPARERHRPTASAVAADGLGHLAAAPVALAGVAGLLGALAAYLLSPACRCTTPTPPWPRATRRARWPAATLSRLGTYMVHGGGPCGLTAGGAGADRGLRPGRRSWPGSWRPAPSGTPGPRALAGPAGPLAKLAPLAVTLAAAAGAFSVLFSWYFAPFSPTGLRQTSGCLPGSLPACSTCTGWRSRPGRWPPARSAPWPACSSAGSSPRIAATMAASAGLALAAGAVPAPALPDPLVAHNPQPAWFRVDHQLDGTPRAAESTPSPRRRSASLLQGATTPPSNAGRTTRLTDDRRPGGLFHHPARLPAPG